MGILEQLAAFSGDRGRVVSFELSTDKQTVTVCERCDDYFSADLTKAEFAQMIRELMELHSQMSD